MKVDLEGKMNGEQLQARLYDLRGRLPGQEMWLYEFALELGDRMSAAVSTGEYITEACDVLMRMKESEKSRARGISFISLIDVYLPRVTKVVCPPQIVEKI